MGLPGRRHSTALTRISVNTFVLQKTKHCFGRVEKMKFETSIIFLEFMITTRQLDEGGLQ